MLPSRPSPPRRQLILLSVLAVVCLGLRLNRGLFVDEYATYAAIRLPLREMLLDRVKNGHLPGYFLLLKSWSALAGISEVVLRLPGAILGLGAVLAFTLFAIESFGRRTGLLAGLLFTTHQLTVWSGQTARPYSGMLLFATLAALALVRWWNSGRQTWLAVLAGTSLLGMTFQAAFGLSLLAFLFALALAIRRDPRKVLPAAAAIILPILVCLLPLKWFAGAQEKYESDRFRTRFGSVPNALITSVGNVAFGEIDSHASKRLRYPAALLFVALAASAVAARRRPKNPDDSAAEHVQRETPFPVNSFAWCWLGVPVATLTLAQAFMGVSLLSHERYFVPAFGGIVLISALGLRSLFESSNPKLVRLGVPVLILVLALQLWNTLAHWLTNGDGTRVVAKEMNAAETKIPVIGRVDPYLTYEYRNHRPELHDTHPFPPEQRAAEAAKFLAGRTAWLFVYNNKRGKDEPLDALLETPPPTHRIEKRLESQDARAALFAPK